jgi:hypothetical protein
LLETYQHDDYLPTLNSTQLTRAVALLDEEWLAHDPELGPVMPLVLGRGVGKTGTRRERFVIIWWA